MRGMFAPPHRVFAAPNPAAAAGTVYPSFPYDPTRSISSGSLYVSPTGSDANNGLSQGSPKATLSGAISALGTSSSKKIYLMNGTHNTGGTLLMSGTGTAGIPIEVTSLPGHTPVVNMQGDASGTYIDVAFRLDSAAYWRFSHLSWTNWAMGFFCGENVSADNCTWFCNEGTTARTADNAGFIHFVQQDRAVNPTIDRIRLTFTGDATASINHTQNTAGIYWRRITPTSGLLDHFEIYGFPVGVYHKHGEPNPTQQGLVIARNGIVADIYRVPMGFNPSGWLYQNVIMHGSVERLSEADGGSAGDLNYFDHCTIAQALQLSNQDQFGYPGAQFNTLRNSYVSQLTLESPSSIAPANSDYNLFPSGSSAITRYGTNLTLAGWQAANSSDAHSIQSTPTFVGGSARSAASYALSAGSPGKNAASDGTDIGVDVTRIGAQAA